MNVLSLEKRIADLPAQLQAQLTDWSSLPQATKKEVKSDVLFEAYNPNLKLKVILAVLAYMYSNKNIIFTAKQNTEIAGAFFGGGTGYYAIELLKDILAVDYNAHPLEESLVAAFGGYLATNILNETELGKQYAQQHQQILQAFNLFVIGAYGLPVVIRALMSGSFDQLYK